MTSFEDLNENELVPGWVRQLVMVSLAVMVILLYGGILGVAMHRTVHSAMPQITDGMEKAVAILSGLVGTVVTAGFASSKRATTVQTRGLRPVGAEPPSFWERHNLRQLTASKMMGLARTVGLPAVTTTVRMHAADEDLVDADAMARGRRSNRLAMWLAIVYFLVYFLVGLGAFGLTVLRESVPAIVSNAAWVWLGTLVSAGYAFFGIDPA
ncbi:MAG: hypothetical protein ABFD20_08240 [Anaerolineales bacterium]